MNRKATAKIFAVALSLVIAATVVGTLLANGMDMGSDGTVEPGGSLEENPGEEETLPPPDEQEPPEEETPDEETPDGDGDEDREEPDPDEEGSDGEDEDQEREGEDEQPETDSKEETNGEDAADAEEENTAPEDEMQPQYIEEDGWALVGDFADFKKAIGDGWINIRLTQDLYMEEKILLTRDLVIDGARDDQGGRWTIYEQQTNRTLRLNATYLTVTVQNVNIVGYDHYGFVSQRDTNSSGSHAHVIYRNVYYYGTQLAWMHYEGTLEIWDSQIEIVQLGPESQGEVGEAAQFILGGDVWIEKKSGGDSLFWIYNRYYNNDKQGLLRIEEDANVTITDGEYLTYRELGENGVNSYRVEIGKNATVNMHTRYGWCLDSSRYIDEFIVGEGARVTMSRVAVGTSRVLHIDKTLSIGRGSTFIMEDSVSPISLRTAGAQVIIDNPDYVRIDCGITGQRPGEMTLTAQAFNYWTSSATDGKPDGIYNPPRGETATVTYTTGKAVYEGIDSGKTETDDVAAFLPFGNSRLKGFAMGAYSLEVDKMLLTSTDITGAMSHDAELWATYYKRGDEVGSGNTTTTKAVPQHSGSDRTGFRIDPQVEPEQGMGAFARDQDIRFELVRTVAHPADSKAKAVSQLHAVQERPFPQPGPISLSAVPATLDFGQHEIPSAAGYLPLQADAEVVLVDNRPPTATSTWALMAASTPMESDDTDETIDGNAIGILRDGRFESLNSGVLLWSGSQKEEDSVYSKVWSAQDTSNGLVVHVDPYRARAAKYRSTITWTLSVGV